MEQIATVLLKKYADILKPMVKAIEEKPETTQGHYGDYMTLIDRCTATSPPEQKDKRRQFTALALISAGADITGVKSAIGLLTGASFV